MYGKHVKSWSFLLVLSMLIFQFADSWLQELLGPLQFASKKKTKVSQNIDTEEETPPPSLESLFLHHSSPARLVLALPCTCGATHVVDLTKGGSRKGRLSPKNHAVSCATCPGFLRPRRLSRDGEVVWTKGGEGCFLTPETPRPLPPPNNNMEGDGCLRGGSCLKERRTGVHGHTVWL